MSRILLAISERWVPDLRVDALAEFARRIGSSIIVVHVVYGAGAESAAPGERTLEVIAQRLRTAEISVETLLLFADDFSEALLKTAAEKKCSMIILGLSAKALLTRLLQGDPSQDVIKTSRVPVLLLPPEWDGTW
jgi:nucleotide-binding universal stress UspA family protein